MAGLFDLLFQQSPFSNLSSGDWKGALSKAIQNGIKIGAGYMGGAGMGGAGAMGAGAGATATAAPTLAESIGSMANTGTMMGAGGGAMGAMGPTAAGASSMGGQGLSLASQFGNMMRNPQATGAMMPNALKTMGGNALNYLKTNPPKVSMGSNNQQPRGVNLNVGKMAGGIMGNQQNQLDPNIIAQIIQQMKSSGMF